MTELENWAFPERLQPRQADLHFDLQAALDAVVLLRAEIPDDAFTAGILGTERVGNGVVIRDDGLILTIGYLVTEAESVWISGNDGRVVQGHPLAYDQSTGFGLVLPLGPLDLRAMPRGSSAAAEVDDEVLVIGHGGRVHALKANISGKREFAGYWEYLLDEAMFTTPAHPQWSGAALVGADGKLLGIGSLLVGESQGNEPAEGNMFVPIDLLEPVLEDLLQTGRSARLARPWLGMYTTESNGQLIVHGLARGGPADRAGVRLGDAVLEVAGRRVATLAELFRSVWRLGPVGTDIPLTLAHKGAVKRVQVRSGDRGDYLKKPQLH